MREGRGIIKILRKLKYFWKSRARHVIRKHFLVGSAGVCLSIISVGCGGAQSAVDALKPSSASSSSPTPSSLSGFKYDNTALSANKNVVITPLNPVFDQSETRTFSISPPLPAGLTLNTSTGVISGTPTAKALENFYSVRADDSNGSAKTTLNIEVLSTSPTLSTVSSDLNTLTANGTSLATVTVTCLNSAGVPVSGELVHLTSSRGSADTITNISPTTDSSGIATFSIKSVVAGSPTFAATDSSDHLLIIGECDFHAGYYDSIGNDFGAEHRDLGDGV